MSRLLATAVAGLLSLVAPTYAVAGPASTPDLTASSARARPPDVGRFGPWRTIEPGGATGCAFDTPYRFFYREGSDPSRLLVYFEGGGACWDFVSCSGMFDTDVEDDEVADFRGIFDASNPANPFRTASVLFVPYCTGDVHVGDATGVYGEESWNTRPVEHRGWVNAIAALDWAERNVTPPERIVVAGASAGSYGAVFHSPNVAARFPGSALVVIGDSGVPLLHDYPNILEGWGAGDRLRTLWRESADVPVTLDGAYSQIARVRSGASIALVTSDHDAVQSAFYLVSGSPGWRDATFALLHRLETELPRFRAFVVDGTEHGLLRTDRFYTLEADGVALRDWVDDLAAGAPVTSIYCDSCRGEETP